MFSPISQNHDWASLILPITISNHCFQSVFLPVSHTVTHASGKFCFFNFISFLQFHFCYCCLIFSRDRIFACHHPHKSLIDCSSTLNRRNTIDWPVSLILTNIHYEWLKTHSCSIEEFYIWFSVIVGIDNRL